MTEPSYSIVTLHLIPGIMSWRVAGDFLVFERKSEEKKEFDDITWP
jgi:hypothetical protein